MPLTLRLLPQWRFKSTNVEFTTNAYRNYKSSIQYYCHHFGKPLLAVVLFIHRVWQNKKIKKCVK